MADPWPCCSFSIPDWPGSCCCQTCHWCWDCSCGMWLVFHMAAESVKVGALNEGRRICWWCCNSALSGVCFLVLRPPYTLSGWVPGLKCCLASPVITTISANDCPRPGAESMAWRPFGAEAGQITPRSVNYSAVFSSWPIRLMLSKNVISACCFLHPINHAPRTIC